MKLDMANYTIQQMRPLIQQQSLEYERKKFQEFLDKSGSMYMYDLSFKSYYVETIIFQCEILEFSSEVCNKYLCFPNPKGNLF